VATDPPRGRGKMSVNCRLWLQAWTGGDFLLPTTKNGKKRRDDLTPLNSLPGAVNHKVFLLFLGFCKIHDLTNFFNSAMNSYHKKLF
jgi:hypothetical protein